MANRLSSGDLDTLVVAAPLKHLFSAPFLRCVWKNCADLNETLRVEILKKRDVMPSECMSNAGGWQSPKKLHKWEGACFEQLTARINLAVRLVMAECLNGEAVARLDPWEIAAWANVNQKGDYNMIHNHEGAVWSGIYFVSTDVPDPSHPLSGAVVFRNPTLVALAVGNLNVRDAFRELFPADYLVSPQPGLMLVFPSWLEHQVHPYFGDRPRISVSWDVVFRNPAQKP